MIRTKATHVEANVGIMRYKLDLPAGLQCRLLNGSIVLAEFPHPWFPPFSCIKHDGEQGKFVLTPEQVEQAA